MMPRRVTDEKRVTVADARKVLEKAKQEELGEFQRRTLDYTTKFSRLPGSDASKLVDALVSQFKLERSDAIQIVNCMPATMEELRAILAVKGRVIPVGQLDDVLKAVNNVRKEETR
jgi:DNA-directed RNA polymerase subunit F